MDEFLRIFAPSSEGTKIRPRHALAIEVFPAWPHMSFSVHLGKRKEKDYLVGLIVDAGCSWHCLLQWNNVE